MGILKYWLPRRDQIPGSIVKRVNFIVRMVVNPCDAPLVIYVETMWPAALEAAITAVDFSIGDIARCIFRPWGLRAKPGVRQRKGKRPKLIRRLLYKLPLLRKIQNRKIGRNLKWMWIFDTKLQHVLLWFLIIDVVSEFLYRWTSALYCTKFCLMSQAPGAALAHSPGDVHLALSGWTIVVWPQVEYEHGGASFNLAGARMDDGLWQLCAGTTVRAKTGGFLDISMRMRIPGNPQMIDQDGPVQVTLTQSADLVCSGLMTDPDRAIIEVRSEGGNFETIESYFSVIGMPPDGNPLCTCD